MSDLTYRLEHEKPSRKLCVEASNRIGKLEQALIDMEAYFMVGQNLPGDAEPLDHIMKALKQ